jgi:atypical dual specificity phosphatase
MSRLASILEEAMSVWNFSFVIPGKLAGMARPGRYGPLAQDLAFLKAQGIRAIVSVTEYALDITAIETAGFDYLHLPVDDYEAPTLEQIETFLRFLEVHQADGAVGVHCAAGQGRTGVLLACAFVVRGMTADEAIAHVRALRPPSIDTPNQEKIVHAFMRSPGA